MKRILLLDHPQFTSCTNYLWHGLRELEEQYPEELMVTVYPFIPTHYDERKFRLTDLPWFNQLSEFVKAWKQYPAGLPFGIPPFQESETLTSLDTVEILRNETTPRLFHQRNLMQDEETVVKLLRENYFDLVILGNSHRVPTIMLALLKKRWGHFPPVVYLDAGERDELNEHWIHVFRPNVVFKQILTPEVKARGLTTAIPGYTLKMYPLPLSSPIVDQNVEYFTIPIQWLREFSNCRARPKVFPVFYHMGATWPERQGVMQALDRWVESSRCSVGRGGSTAPYHVLLALSKMGVSMRGSGRDTTRYWEIPLYQTALVADGTMGCIHPYPFEDRKTAFFYRSIDELIDIVNRNQKDDREMLDVAERGQSHLKRYHSTAARAVFFLDILDAEFGFQNGGLRERLLEWKRDRGWEARSWEGPVV